VSQVKVLKNALDLLERPSGGILENFPEESPDWQEVPASMVCPIQFKSRSSEQKGVLKHVDAFQAEIL
jgi:hypothetical protein